MRRSRSSRREDFLAKLVEARSGPVVQRTQNTKSIIKHALGWLDFPKAVSRSRATELQSRSRPMMAKEFYKHVVVLGMGGSSLAPDTFCA